ncbi:carbohydrate ABC transporter permease [Plantactinospora sp. S1510]|uniref:Carbohydrate ABC transporter permease n=1 Tax=Plantactinospora alkalitolerans TaxID=2789879 RepID=A0ABS0GT11_9ACTN|nr:carbohydrate ABC transporter permease [Plantactinospora alkalitolerans]MBF9129336.1 carbohydrate ABC transporter permease [Plantactinospora alkalitolerans]
MTDLGGSEAPATRRARSTRSRSVGARIAVILKYVSLVLASVVVLLPLVALLMASLKTNDEYVNGEPFDAPGNWFNVDNYVTAFNEGGMLRAFVNTSIILVVSLAGTVLIGSMAAYALDRFQFRFRKTIILLFLLATLVPGVTTQVATFQVVNNLGLFNTRWSAIALFLGTDIISIYIFQQFLRSIPRELDESAAIEGANSLTIYFRIILPLLKPAIATVVIIKGITIYNEFFIPFLYMPDRDLGVISTSLFRFKGPFGARWEVISAGVILVIVPTLIVFLLLQRFIYNGFTSGATK